MYVLYFMGNKRLDFNLLSQMLSSSNLSCEQSQLTEGNFLYSSRGLQE